MAISVSNEILMVGPEQDMLAIYTILKETYQQEEVDFLLDRRLRWRCETRREPAMQFIKQLSLQFPRTTIGWWCWAEWGEFYCCQIVVAGCAEWDHYGRMEYDEDSFDTAECCDVVLYEKTIDLFLSCAALRCGLSSDITRDGDIAEVPEEENDYDLF